MDSWWFWVGKEPIIESYFFWSKKLMEFVTESKIIWMFQMLTRLAGKQNNK